MGNPYRAPSEHEPAGARPAPALRWHDLVRGAAAVLAVGAAVVAVALVDIGSDEGRTWTFVEDTADPTELGLRTGMPAAGVWRLEDHAEATGARALANHAGSADGPPAVAIAAGESRRDVLVQTRCRTAPGAAERGCGLVFRHASDQHHYVARVDVASDRVVLAVVLAGSERVVASTEIAHEADDRWHDLEVRAQGDHLLVLHDGDVALDVRDPTFPNSGGVGLWAPADCVAWFDHLTVEPLPPVTHPTELLPFLL
jgi:hypothetical protein